MSRLFSSLDPLDRLAPPGFAAFAHRGETFVRGRHIPVVYAPAYNIHFWGLERLHPFDAAKYGKIARALGLPTDRVLTPELPPRAALCWLHDPEYLTAVTTSPSRLAQVTEFPPIAFLPSFVSQRRVLVPMLTALSGTALATDAALKNGIGINLGGGAHHASFGDGGGWCAFADLTLAIRLARRYGGVERIMYIDLDVHQGNGVERDVLEMEAHEQRATYILDAYNSSAYPGDSMAARAINKAVRFGHGCGTERYLELVTKALEEAFREFEPELVVYNAGTDILEGDPLGGIAVSAAGVVKRDELVFDAARSRDIPIVMTLSGGYTPRSAPTVVESLRNLDSKYGFLTVSEK